MHVPLEVAGLKAFRSPVEHACACPVGGCLDYVGSEPKMFGCRGVSLESQGDEEEEAN